MEHERQEDRYAESETDVHADVGYAVQNAPPECLLAERLDEIVKSYKPAAAEDTIVLERHYHPAEERVVGPDQDGQHCGQHEQPGHYVDRLALPHDMRVGSFVGVASGQPSYLH